jgi:large subunit ribosomal protein L10
MPTAEKEQAIKEFTEVLKGATAVIVSHNNGLNAADVTELRKQMRAQNLTFKVVKNTLAARAATAAGIEGLDKYLSGPSTIAISKDSLVSAAKVLTNFAKDHDKLVVVGGVIEGKQVSPAEVQTFASLPSKEELVAMLLRTINGPASGLARVIQAIVDKKTASAGASAPAAAAAPAPVAAAEPAAAPAPEAPAAEAPAAPAAE